MDERQQRHRRLGDGYLSVANGTKVLPLEVEVALQAMPCQAMRRGYDSNVKPHACAHFAEWGKFHAYDYAAAGPPPGPGILHPVRYAGKRPLMPEILSGCRKAPIMAVGINPNLPGWRANERNAIHPNFDDFLQYAHYFRYRSTDKLRIPRAKYLALLAGRADEPATAEPLIAEGEMIDVELSPVTMYRAYQELLDALAERANWQGHRLKVGEDLAYANMVACPSARWTTSLRPGEENMPLMGPARAREIVNECLVKRGYFLRQLMQSLPAVILVFSQTTANALIAALAGRFSKGEPRAGESLRDLSAREIRLRLGRTAGGDILDARVIFAPHASANPDDFHANLGHIVGELMQEVDSGRLRINPQTRRLARGRGGCLFCENALYKIGACDYRDELEPLSGADFGLLTDPPGPGDPAAERAEHLRLLAEFVAPPAAPVDASLLDAAAPSAPPTALLGRIVTMAGETIENGAIYLAQGAIVAVQEATAAPPKGFDAVERIDTQAVIFPGLSDLHNHLAYNVLPLWWPPTAKSNRAQWLRMSDYRSRVPGVMKALTEQRDDLVRAVVRYVEVKLVMGGATSGQGMKTRYGGYGYFAGLGRNFEQPDDDNLPEIRHRLLDIGTRDIDEVRRGLQANRYFLHLAEGTDAAAQAQFQLLQDNNLLAASLVGIHSLGLRAEDIGRMQQAGAKIAWSPFSNCLLYGRTLDIDMLRQSGVAWGLGSDWTPSGSRNMLQEMKVAWLVAQNSGSDLTARELAEAVTRNGAAIAGWGDRLGKLVAGHYADLLIVRDRGGDVYDGLLNSVETDVELVIIAGHARYGADGLMRRLVRDQRALEPLTVGGKAKALNLNHPSSPINNLSFGAARRALADALADLPAARDAGAFGLQNDGPRVELELDMQDLGGDGDDFGLLADLPLPQSVPLDLPTLVDDPDYWAKLDSIGHLPAYLKGPNGLRRFYA